MVLFSNALKLELYKIFQCKLSMISLLKAVSVYSVKFYRQTELHASCIFVCHCIQ